MTTRGRCPRCGGQGTRTGWCRVPVRTVGDNRVAASKPAPARTMAGSWIDQLSYGSGPAHRRDDQADHSHRCAGGCVSALLAPWDRGGRRSGEEHQIPEKRRPVGRGRYLGVSQPVREESKRCARSTVPSSPPGQARECCEARAALPRVATVVQAAAGRANRSVSK